MSPTCSFCGSTATKLSYNRVLANKKWELAVCSGCGLHFTDPVPTNEEIASFYTGNYHEDIRDYSASEAAQSEKYARYASMLGRHLPDGKVVDIGCSTGLLVKMLRDKGYQAEGVEMDTNSAEWGRTHYGVTIHTVPLKQCSYADGSLDGLLLMDVLEHTQNPLAFLSDIKDLLRPGGIILVSFPDIRALESRYWHGLSKLLRRNWLWNNNCHIPLHVWEFTPKTASAMFRKAGFEIVEFSRSAPPLESTDMTLLKVLRLPTLPLYLGPMQKLFGSQMEFAIRKP